MLLNKLINAKHFKTFVFFILLKGEGVLRNSEATLLFEMSVCPYESFFYETLFFWRLFKDKLLKTPVNIPIIRKHN